MYIATFLSWCQYSKSFPNMVCSSHEAIIWQQRTWKIAHMSFPWHIYVLDRSLTGERIEYKHLSAQMCLCLRLRWIMKWLTHKQTRLNSRTMLRQHPYQLLVSFVRIFKIIFNCCYKTQHYIKFNQNSLETLVGINHKSINFDKDIYLPSLPNTKLMIHDP